MRISSYAVARPAYYDRNAASVSGNYGATVGPHAATTRFTYTVPSGKKCVVEAVYAHILRQTAATALGIVQLYSGTNTVRSVNLAAYNNTVYSYYPDKATTQLTVYGGASFTAVSADAGTGGTNEIIIQFNGTEFDA